MKLAPDLSVRPIIAYYLQKLGKPVPELPGDDDVGYPITSTAPAEPKKGPEGSAQAGTRHSETTKK